MSFNHMPVLLEETIESLNIKPDGIYVDGTLGGAGHSMEICRRLDQSGMLVGIDQDMAAIEASSKKLPAAGKNIKMINDNFKNIKAVLKQLNIQGIDGAVLDLGVSSHQLDEPIRGFSYQHDAPLDMRMDRNSPVTAEKIINEYIEDELTGIIRSYGEEKWAARIASFIVKERAKAPIKTTGRLVEIIKAAIPAAARREGAHPARRTFQAVRIAVNDELGLLGKAVEDFIDVLKPGGRLCVITFHSLEDRIIKNTFNKKIKPCTCPPDFPVCACGKRPEAAAVYRKPVEPGRKELENNPRSRSAKLRVVEKAGFTYEEFR